MRLCFVIQRFGLEVAGGSELHCRWLAGRLARRHQVEVVTTCALDYTTWAEWERLDAHEIGKWKDLVELGETDTFTDRDKLIRQKGSLPGKLAGARQSAVDGTAIG